MKRLSLLVLLTLTGGLRADQAVVFGERDYYVLDAIPAPSGPSEPGRLAFFNACKADLAHGPSYEKTADLVNPPSWGKTISAGTRGVIRYHPSFTGGFVCHLALEGMLPLHDYILTLNGNPARAGNGLLLSPVPGNGQERYYDFLIIKADRNGRYDASLGIYLEKGAYDVRCYVKDTGDFKIVLYRDFFEFEVR